MAIQQGDTIDQPAFWWLRLRDLFATGPGPSQPESSRIPYRAPRDQVVPVLCLLVLVAISILGGLLALFSWVAVTFPDLQAACPDFAECVSRHSPDSLSCETGEAACTAAAEGGNPALTVDAEVVP